MCKSAAEEESCPDNKEDKSAPGVHGAGPSCVAEEAHWIEPDQETDDSDSGVPDKLSYYVRENESGPVVCAAFAFPMQRSKLVMGGQGVSMS